jgi:hypothetical protein
VPAGSLPGTTNGLRAAVGFDDYALVFTASGADTLASRVDSRGKVTGARSLPGLVLAATSRVTRAGTGAIIARPLPGNLLGVTRVDGDGALVGAIDAVKINLAVSVPTGTVGSVDAAADGTKSIWVLWNMTAPGGANVLLLRAFGFDGAPQSTDQDVSKVATNNLRLTVGGGVAQATWQSVSPVEVGWATGRYDPAGSPTTRISISNLGDVAAAATPLRFGTTGALIYPVTTGTTGTGGVLVNPTNQLVGTPGISTFAGELLAGAPPYLPGSPTATNVGTRGVFATQGSGDLWAGEPNAAIVPGTVSWFDASSATEPLSKQLPSTVRYSFEGATHQAQLADRVLTFGGATALSTTLVWLNRGPVN